ncbi:hypothetical protein B0F90DRAFT_1356106 [Multifurca ochricompacta]|uniref:Uncharacterized protein n=1 Tax=Multifurca ochricompacta TaxID=376703 RepID=A0AAD4LXR6_9AGAM|nr:hypothetical protein B0F90DRAFT_1356106 [Multifurca ochricompacta]
MDGADNNLLREDSSREGISPSCENGPRMGVSSLRRDNVGGGPSITGRDGSGGGTSLMGAGREGTVAVDPQQLPMGRYKDLGSKSQGYKSMEPLDAYEGGRDTGTQRCQCQVKSVNPVTKFASTLVASACSFIALTSPAGKGLLFQQHRQLLLCDNHAACSPNTRTILT